MQQQTVASGHDVSRTGPGPPDGPRKNAAGAGAGQKFFTPSVITALGTYRRGTNIHQATWTANADPGQLLAAWKALHRGQANRRARPDRRTHVRDIRNLHAGVRLGWLLFAVLCSRI